MLNLKVLWSYFRKRIPHPFNSTGLAGEKKNRYIPFRISQLLKIQWPGLSGDTYLLYVRYARDSRRLGSRFGGKRVERVAIREDSRESVRWAAEEKRDMGMRNRGWRERKRERGPLYYELFEQACAPGLMVLVSVAVKVVPSEKAKETRRK